MDRQSDNLSILYTIIGPKGLLASSIMDQLGKILPRTLEFNVRSKIYFCQNDGFYTRLEFQSDQEDTEVQRLVSVSEI